MAPYQTPGEPTDWSRECQETAVTKAKPPKVNVRTKIPISLSIAACTQLKVLNTLLSTPSSCTNII